MLPQGGFPQNLYIYIYIYELYNICRLPCASEVAEVARSESILVARLYATVPRAPNIWIILCQFLEIIDYWVVNERQFF